MSENCREILQGALILIAVLALGLLVGQIVLKLQKPEIQVGPAEGVLQVHPAK